MDSLLKRSTIDPSICHGKPCIRGLRYPVETLLELLSSGMTEGQILADYPDLEHEDLLAVFAFLRARGGCNRWRCEFPDRRTFAASDG